MNLISPDNIVHTIALVRGNNLTAIKVHGTLNLNYNIAWNQGKSYTIGQPTNIQEQNQHQHVKDQIPWKSVLINFVIMHSFQQQMRIITNEEHRLYTSKNTVTMDLAIVSHF